MAAPDKGQLSLWEKGQTERWRVVRIAHGTLHSLIPKILGWHLHPVRLFFGSIRILCLLILSLVPIWLKVYDATLSSDGKLFNATWTQAIWLSAVLPVCLLYNYGYDRIVTAFKAKRTKRKLLIQLSEEIRGTISGFSQHLRLKQPKEGQEHARDACRKVLEWIRKVAQVHVADYEGSCIQVSLLIFADDQGREMKVKERTTRSRQIGTVVTAQDVMAYYVAKGGKHRCINDFLKDPHPFEKTGLSDPDPPYRSILLIPLLDTQGGGPDNCMGVVSIDSTQPYQFWPGGGLALVQKVSPFCSWLAVVLSLSNACSVRRSTLP